MKRRLFLQSLMALSSIPLLGRLFQRRPEVTYKTTYPYQNVPESGYKPFLMSVTANGRQLTERRDFTVSSRGVITFHDVN